MAYALPSNSELRAVIGDRMRANQAKESDWLEDPNRFFLRATRHIRVEVLPEDTMSPGLAARRHGGVVELWPYVFREICTNGAIMARCGSGRQIDLADPDARDLVAATADRCLSEQAWATCRASIAGTANQHLDLAMALVPLMRRMGNYDSSFLMDVVQGLGQGRRLFDIMQAVTASAHRTTDPEEKWRREEEGGSLAFLSADDLDPRIGFAGASWDQHMDMAGSGRRLAGSR